MADSVGSSESEWGSLADSLKSVGMTVIEAGGDRLANEIRNTDKFTSNDEERVKLTQHQGQPTIDGQAIPTEGAFMGTLRSVDPQKAMVAVAALLALLFVAKRV